MIWFIGKRHDLRMTAIGKILTIGIFVVLLLPLSAWAVTNNFQSDGNWSDPAKWSQGHIPTSSEDVTISSGVTSMVIDTSASAKTFVPTGASGTITISGSGNLTVYGDFTLDSHVTWTNTGVLSFTTNPVSLNTAGKSLSTLASLNIIGGAAVSLSTNNLDIGTADLIIYGSGTSFTTNNLAVSCGTLGDNWNSGPITLALGSSTINVLGGGYYSPQNDRLLSFQEATPTVTGATATVNVSVAQPAADLWIGGQTWPGTMTITTADGATANFMGFSAGLTNTFGNLTIVANPSLSASGIYSAQNINVTGTLTFTVNPGPYSVNARGLFASYDPNAQSSPVAGGTQINVSAANFVMNGAIDFRGIKNTGTIWDLHNKASGDVGGNSGIIFRAPETLWLTNADYQYDYDNVYSTTDSPRSATAGVVFLPQDTIIIDNNSFASPGSWFIFHHGRVFVGNVDASNLTMAESISLPVFISGNINYSGSGITITGTPVYTVDARLVYERTGEPLDLNIPASIPAGIDIPIISYGGTVRLAGDLSADGTVTLHEGTLDLNGKTLKAGIFTASVETPPRTIKDSAGGGKIVVTGTTGTIFDLSTPANLTVSGALKIDIGDGTQTLSNDVTFAGGGKTFGDFTVRKHAGNYAAIIKEADTFGTITLETPDATYQYSKLKLPASATTTCSGFVSNGTASYKNDLSSSNSAASKLSIPSGTISVTNTAITNSTATGSAAYYAYTALGNTDGGNNNGWIFTNPVFTLNFTTDGNGTLTGTILQSIVYNGSSTAVTAHPTGGYGFLNWTGTNGFVTTTANPLTVTSVTANQTITAHFYALPINGTCGTDNGQTLAATAPTILCSAGAPSAVTGNGHPWSWTCAGVNGGSTANCSASIQTYTLTFNTDGHGTLNGTTTQIIDYNGTATLVSATANSGYTFNNWTGTGGFSTTTANPITMTNVTANQTITANFSGVIAAPVPAFNVWGFLALASGLGGYLAKRRTNR